jgi:hypothetical protein
MNGTRAEDYRRQPKGFPDKPGNPSVGADTGAAFSDSSGW